MGRLQPGAPLRLQTHVWNPLGGRRALLVHGLTSDGTCWWRLAGELADAGWMVVAPDLRSHGRSPTAVAHDVATLAADVALLGRDWDLLVGHSLGGSIAAHLLAGSNAIEAAVLVDPVLRLDDAGRAQIAAGGASLGPGASDAAAIRAAEPSWDERDVQRKVLASALVTPDIVTAVLEDNDPWDVTPLIRDWRGRVHVLAADPARGGLLDPGDVRKLAAGHDRARITTELVVGCGHSIQRERPDVVSAAVARVVADRSGDAGRADGPDALPGGPPTEDHL